MKAKHSKNKTKTRTLIFLQHIYSTSRNDKDNKMTLRSCSGA